MQNRLRLVSMQTPPSLNIIKYGKYMFNNLNDLSGDRSKLWAWNLFWWKIEGCEPLNGLNVYPKNDPRSRGFVLKFGSFRWRVRYSRYAKEWHINVQW